MYIENADIEIVQKVRADIEGRLGLTAPVPGVRRGVPRTAADYPVGWVTEIRPLRRYESLYRYEVDAEIAAQKAEADKKAELDCTEYELALRDVTVIDAPINGDALEPEQDIKEASR
jgi:hypothetical protein